MNAVYTHLTCAALVLLMYIRQVRKHPGEKRLQRLLLVVALIPIFNTYAVLIGAVRWICGPGFRFMARTVIRLDSYLRSLINGSKS